MENNVEVRTDTGLRTTFWLTTGGASPGQEADPFSTELACHSQANPFKDQEGDFFQNLFDGIVQQFGEEPSNQGSSGDRTLFRDGSSSSHAASGKTETSIVEDQLAWAGEKNDKAVDSTETTINSWRQDMVACGERHGAAVGRDFAAQCYDSETGQHHNHNKYSDPSLVGYPRPDPIGLERGVNTDTYVKDSPIYGSSPFGLGVWRCKRPLNGQPTENAPPVFYHAFVCARDEKGQMYCGSTTPKDNSSWSKKLLGTESRPTTGDDGDYYVESACEEVDELDEKDPLCVERCVIGELQSDWRPTFAVGPRGADCQEWTDDILDNCTTICSKSWNDDRLDYIRENPKPPARYR